MKGEVDVFLIGLVVGIIVIVAAYVGVMWRGVTVDVNSSNVIESPSRAAAEALEFPASGLVGESPDLAGIKRDFGPFHVSYVDSFEYYGNMSMEIRNGILYGKNRIDFVAQLGNLDEISAAWLVFDVMKSNKYGKLVAVVGNCTLSDMVLYPGHYEFQVPLSCLSESSVVVLYPRSSWWRLWAPTYYEIGGASLKVSRYYSKPAIMRFSLDESQYNDFQEADLYLNLIYYTGNISVTVNNREVYSGSPNDQMVITIYKDDVRRGMNEIRVFASRNGEIKGKASIQIIYSQIVPHKVQQEFYIDGNAMKALKDGGYVSFYVTRVYRNGGVSLKIYDRSGRETFSKYLDLREGLYNVPITDGDVSYGRNVAEISAIDGGLFEVSGIQIVG